MKTDIKKYKCNIIKKIIDKLIKIFLSNIFLEND